MGKQRSKFPHTIECIILINVKLMSLILTFKCCTYYVGGTLKVIVAFDNIYKKIYYNADSILILCYICSGNSSK